MSSAMMAIASMGELLRTLGDIDDVITTDRDISELTRLFWFTVELGLVSKTGKRRSMVLDCCCHTVNLSIACRTPCAENRSNWLR